MEVKDKALLRPCSITQEIDQHCSKGFRPANSIVTKAGISSSSMKDYRVEEPKVQTQEATFLYYFKSTKTSDRKTQKEKKKRYCYDQA